MGSRKTMDGVEKRLRSSAKVGRLRVAKGRFALHTRQSDLDRGVARGTTGAVLEPTGCRPGEFLR